MLFAGISLSGFGGVLAWARRGLVERKRWMSAEEFNDAFALCQILPGPNIVNMAAVFGARFAGVPGAIAAFLGLMGPPALIVTVIGIIYTRYSDIATLQRILGGIAAAAVGLFIATVLKMAWPLIKQRSLHVWSIIVIVFVAVGLMRFSMPVTLAVMVPLNMLLVWWMKR